MTCAAILITLAAGALTGLIIWANERRRAERGPK